MNNGKVCMFCLKDCFVQDPLGTKARFATCNEGMSYDRKTRRQCVRDRNEKANAIRCIKCGRINAVKKISDDEYSCTHCNIRFDPADDGDIGKGGPDARLNRRGNRRLR